jgi:hypothetical protein
MNGNRSHSGAPYRLIGNGSRSSRTSRGNRNMFKVNLTVTKTEFNAILAGLRQLQQALNDPMGSAPTIRTS